MKREGKQGLRDRVCSGVLSSEDFDKAAAKDLKTVADRHYNRSSFFGKMGYWVDWAQAQVTGAAVTQYAQNYLDAEELEQSFSPKNK